MEIIYKYKFICIYINLYVYIFIFGIHVYMLICIKQKTTSSISLYESSTLLLSSKQNLCNYLYIIIMFNIKHNKLQNNVKVNSKIILFIIKFFYKLWDWPNKLLILSSAKRLYFSLCFGRKWKIHSYLFN